jgi:hypothetical protein
VGPLAGIGSCALSSPTARCVKTRASRALRASEAARRNAALQCGLSGVADSSNRLPLRRRYGIAADALSRFRADELAVPKRLTRHLRARPSSTQSMQNSVSASARNKTDVAARGRAGPQTWRGARRDRGAESIALAPYDGTNNGAFSMTHILYDLRTRPGYAMLAARGCVPSIMEIRDRGTPQETRSFHWAVPIDEEAAELIPAPITVEDLPIRLGQVARELHAAYRYPEAALSHIDAALELLDIIQGQI